MINKLLQGQQNNTDSILWTTNILILQASWIFPSTWSEKPTTWGLLHANISKSSSILWFFKQYQFLWKHGGKKPPRAWGCKFFSFNLGGNGYFPYLLCKAPMKIQSAVRIDSCSLAMDSLLYPSITMCFLVFFKLLQISYFMWVYGGFVWYQKGFCNSQKLCILLKNRVKPTPDKTNYRRLF